MKRLHNICLGLILALALCLCGCSGKDVTLPTRLDLMPGEQVALIDVAEYVGDDEVGVAEMLGLLAEAQRQTELLEFGFTSSAPSVATVDSQGVVTAKQVGDTVVTAVCKPLDFSAQITVRVRGYATELDIEDTARLAVGDVYPLTVKVDGPVALRYTSSDPTVASVDADGVLRALRDGQATVTVTAPGSSLQDDCVVTVGNTVQSISLSSATAQLLPGERMRLVAGTWPVEKDNMTWHSDAPDVATVKNGMVTAVGDGTAIITATVDGKTAACEVTVGAAATPETATEDVTGEDAAADETEIEPLTMTESENLEDVPTEQEQTAELDASAALDKLPSQDLGVLLEDASSQFDAYLKEYLAKQEEILTEEPKSEPEATPAPTPAPAADTPAPVLAPDPTLTMEPELPGLRLLGPGPALPPATPENATPESATPESAAPKPATPESATPENATPETATPEDATPETATSESAAPAVTTPETATEAPAKAFEQAEQSLLDRITNYFSSLFGG